MAGIPTISSVAEHLLDMAALRSDTQILLAQCPGMIMQIVLLLHFNEYDGLEVIKTAWMTYKLLRQRDLLELHLVDSCGCGAQHRGDCQDKITLHGDNDSKWKSN